MIDLGPTQVKCECGLIFSSIFDAMNFQHILEKLEIMLVVQHFRKMLEIHCIKNC